jgi:signal transduction histidine kinase
VYLNDWITRQWQTIRGKLEIADIAFASIRLIILCGGLGWLLFTDFSSETVRTVGSAFIFFVIYSVVVLGWLLTTKARQRLIYKTSLFFDLLFAFLLVRATGGFESAFLNGFYLITALYSFYFGLVPGIIIACVSVVLALAGSFGYEEIHWTDFLVRMAFLYLLAVPLGMLAQKLKSDREKIEKLNQDLKRNLEELKDVQEKLIQAEKLSAIGRLTADVAHEIRNPLTSIGGFARRLNNKLEDGSKEKGYAEIVVAEVDRLERILKDVLTFSREAKYDMEYQDINNPVRESIMTFSDICRDQSVVIEEKLDAALPPVLIDSGQVRQAVNNMISNAIDVMADGGRLTVESFMEEFHEVHYVVIEVSDTGPGLPADALNMIFEPFYTTKEIGAGTGLGLSICKKILDEHNGLLFAYSELGKGTSFKMMFPYQDRENGKRVPCWEYTKCGVEKAEGATQMRCPAYPNYGRICWAIAGTYCGKKVSGAIAQKLGNCKKCEYYQHVAVRKDL